MTEKISSLCRKSTTKLRRSAEPSKPSRFNSRAKDMLNFVEMGNHAMAERKNGTILALQLVNQGEVDTVIADWKKLYKDAPPGQPRGPVQSSMEDALMPKATGATSVAKLAVGKRKPGVALAVGKRVSRLAETKYEAPELEPSDEEEDSDGDGDDLWGDIMGGS